MIIEEKYIDSDGQELFINISNETIEHYIISPYTQDYIYHRLDGPAIESFYSGYEWWRNGIQHRIGGPAYFNGMDYYQWSINGKPVNIYYICG